MRRCCLNTEAERSDTVVNVLPQRFPTCWFELVPRVWGLRFKLLEMAAFPRAHTDARASRRGGYQRGPGAAGRQREPPLPSADAHPAGAVPRVLVCSRV